MKKEFKKAAQTAQTVTNENVTENQNINATATETTENGELTPTPETEHTPETDTPTQAATTQEQTPKTETIEELQQRIETELSKLNHKKRLARNRETFINCMGSLQLYIDQLENESEFETQSGKIVFKILNAADYNDRTNFVETFTVSNTDLIRKFCTILHSEMKAKKTELETQLLTA
jgi:hypothetical protein